MPDPFAGAEPTLPPYAGWWRRFAAIFIDGLLLALPFVVAIGIRVTGIDFRPIGYGRAFGRALIASLLWIACYLPGILDALWPLWDEKKQSLHDKIANSIVVRA